jgi:ABC-type polysaccharide/polyol phosphate export permease
LVFNLGNRAHEVGSYGLLVCAIVNVATYVVYWGIMFALKFATLKTNLKYLVGLSVISFVIRIIVEISYNISTKSNIINKD